MLCPVCRVEMAARTCAGVEVEHCGECGGLWVPVERLDAVCRLADLAAPALMAALEESGEGAGLSHKRHCPTCRRMLARVRVAARVEFNVDRCPSRHGLWFDRGELATVLAAAGAGEHNALALFLADLERERREKRAVPPQ